MSEKKRVIFYTGRWPGKREALLVEVMKAIVRGEDVKVVAQDEATAQQIFDEAKKRAEREPQREEK